MEGHFIFKMDKRFEKALHKRREPKSQQVYKVSKYHYSLRKFILKSYLDTSKHLSAECPKNQLSSNTTYMEIASEYTHYKGLSSTRLPQIHFRHQIVTCASD